MLVCELMDKEAYGVQDGRKITLPVVRALRLLYSFYHTVDS